MQHPVSAVSLLMQVQRAHRVAVRVDGARNAPLPHLVLSPLRVLLGQALIVCG